MRARKINNFYRRKLKFWDCVFQDLYFHIMWKKFSLHRHFKVCTIFWSDINIMINGSKISVQLCIATTLFRMIKEWPHTSGNFNEWPLNYKNWQLKAKLSVCYILLLWWLGYIVFFFLSVQRMGFPTARDVWVIPWNRRLRASDNRACTNAPPYL